MVFTRAASDKLGRKDQASFEWKCSRSLEYIFLDSDTHRKKPFKITYQPEENDFPHPQDLVADLLMNLNPDCTKLIS